MNQYMDVMPYIAANEAAAAYIAEVEEKQEIPEEAQGNYNEVNNAGVVEKLTESITLNGEEMTLGILCTEMPELFGSQFWDQLMPVHELRYVRAGRNNPEEFYFINLNAKNSETANTLNVKGVMTRNKNYANWGKDNSAFHEFQYENLTQDSTIEDILEQYGAPMELHCTSYARDCFAWMHYEDQAGNTLRICVDPMLNQLIELRVSKYYEGEIYYP